MNAHGRRIYRRQQARITAVAILTFVRKNALRILARVKERLAALAPKTTAAMLAVAVQKLPVTSGPAKSWACYYRSPYTEQLVRLREELRSEL